jgi:hypothetical protein
MVLAEPSKLGWQREASESARPLVGDVARSVVVELPHAPANAEATATATMNKADLMRATVPSEMHNVGQPRQERIAGNG